MRNGCWSFISITDRSSLDLHLHSELIGSKPRYPLENNCHRSQRLHQEVGCDPVIETYSPHNLINVNAQELAYIPNFVREGDWYRQNIFSASLSPLLLN